MQLAGNPLKRHLIPLNSFSSLTSALDPSCVSCFVRRNSLLELCHKLLHLLISCEVDGAESLPSPLTFLPVWLLTILLSSLGLLILTLVEDRHLDLVLLLVLFNTPYAGLRIDCALEDDPCGAPHHQQVYLLFTDLGELDAEGEAFEGTLDDGWLDDFEFINGVL